MGEKIRSGELAIWAVIDAGQPVLYGIAYTRNEALNRFLRYHNKDRKFWRSYCRPQGYRLKKVRVHFDAP